VTFVPLISPDALAALGLDRDLVVIDFRWYLDPTRSGRAAYGRGHLPGAVFVDLERVTGERAGNGRHPLPSGAQFQAAMREAGVNPSSRVVVYDDQGGFSAARLWWLLRYFGHPAVAVLDGGLAAWRGPLSTDPVSPPAGSFVAHPEEAMKLAYPEVSSLGGECLLIDARAAKRFSGEEELVDPIAGHIPGAVNAFWEENLGADGRFLPPEMLRERFSRLGVERGESVVAYCGSGISACHDLLALEVAGFEGARLYAGSWSDWAGRPGAAIAVGPD
jgi:thiosulfate/3-mercaptopyruvate sulfurtransferase